jgi:dTDP-4-dehydrorhamnose reductase
MTTLVLGSGGQVARHLRDTLSDAVYWGRNEQSLEHPAALEAAIGKLQPLSIINVAAYTAVDKAEDEPAQAWRINVEGAAAAARAADTLGVPLIYISTDYVFDGESSRPYRAEDPTRPISVYGKTKLAGELAVSTVCERHWILRASWIFSEFDGSFVTTMLRLAREHEQLRIVCDQHGRPTYAGDLAKIIARLASGSGAPVLPWGTYHVSGGEETTWDEFARRIFRRAVEENLIEGSPAIESIPSSEYPTRARRPSNSVLEPSEKLKSVLAEHPDWHSGLDDVLARLSDST